MPLFGKKKNGTNDLSTTHATISKNDQFDDSTSSSGSSNPSDVKMSKLKKKLTRQNSKSMVDEPTMEQLPGLIVDLETAEETSADRPTRALRMLFALSEHSDTDNRSKMVKEGSGRLVSVLLEFLERCSPKSSEQYLTLLVLNNISIPSENKRIIALDRGGAKVFATLLCNDPSCHLMAIILVNLTFADPDLRRELVSVEPGVGLIESLSFALRVASLTPAEYEARRTILRECLQSDISTAHRLAMFMAEDQRLRPVKTAIGFRQGQIEDVDTIDPSYQLFPETARWCLTAIKNLTRPCKDATAAHILIKSGIFSLILRYIAIPSGCDFNESRNEAEDSLSSGSPTPADPVDDFDNTPLSWDSNSMQDAALFIILNLSACSSSRDYVHDDCVINVLSAITECQTLHLDEECDLPLKQKRQQEFQCLKARMTLAYLRGSQGHYGQAKIKSSASTVFADQSNSDLVMTEGEIVLFVELLANTMQQRGKEGPGGYSAATFSLKYMIFALRCLLTHSSNQKRMADVAGRKLNSLLVKILAQHSMQLSSSLDEESAEHACFTLYLQSNYGFSQPFLPSSFTSEDLEDSLSAKVFTAYLHMPSITPAGRHAAEQILMRYKCLIFSGEIKDLVGSDESFPSVLDMQFEDELLSKAKPIHVGELYEGAKPYEHIFDRPILRARRPTGENARAPWDNRSSMSVFSSALQAVQQLSYGSIKVHHASIVDDILIANNIAKSADGQKTDSYHFMWSWEDTVDEIQRNLDRQRSTETTGPTSIFKNVSMLSQSGSGDHGPFAMLRCAPMCGACSEDTSL